ncbi:unnamed protein product [Pedinophyceae sp. YPF-701]|nr:unnamed protein product [Pedinophyceae sp. YPF-701]
MRRAPRAFIAHTRRPGAAGPLVRRPSAARRGTEGAVRGRSSCRAARTLVDGPPDSWDLEAEFGEQSRAIIRESYPELWDLAEAGVLWAVPRPSLYNERRTDGYQEPEMVLVLGTAHVSQRSEADAARVVRTARPDSVVVELCKSRSSLLLPVEGEEEAQGSPSDTARRRQTRSPLALSGGGLVPALSRAVRLGGQQGLLMRVLLAAVYSSVASATRVNDAGPATPGAEFAAAAKAAGEVDAQVVLGDRPIEITLQRAWAALSLKGQLALAREAAAAVAGGRDRVQAAIASGMQRSPAVASAAAGAGSGTSPWDAPVPAASDVDSMLRQAAAASPDLAPVLGPLLHERDLYIAWSLKRSKAVNGNRCVVGVVGAGHLRGVLYALKYDSGGRQLLFRDLVGGKNRRGAARRELARTVAREALIALVLTAAWVALGLPGSEGVSLPW